MQAELNEDTTRTRLAAIQQQLADLERQRSYALSLEAQAH